MRIIKFDYKRLNILLSFLPTMYKKVWFGFQYKTFLYYLYVNILILGVQFRFIIYRKIGEYKPKHKKKCNG